jgi:hypothetical protein
MVVAEKKDLLAPDLEQYRGQWVAIKDGQVVASAKKADDLVRLLRQRNVEGAALHRVAESPNTAFVL